MTKTSPPPVSPRLAPPGAGLPRPELFVARLMFRWQFWRSSRERTAAALTRERDAILNLVRRGPDEANGCRVLIDRLPGLEDSSRHWSVFMTLDHLRIVNEQIARTIRLLGRGEPPDYVASTAAVKPRADVDGGVVGGFEAACEELERAAAGVADLRTPLRLAHPWFGPLDAAGWHFMAGFHQGLHRQQIEAIRRTDPTPAPGDQPFA